MKELRGFIIDAIRSGDFFDADAAIFAAIPTLSPEHIYEIVAFRNEAYARVQERNG